MVVKTLKDVLKMKLDDIIEKPPAILKSLSVYYDKA